MNWRRRQGKAPRLTPMKILISYGGSFKGPQSPPTTTEEGIQRTRFHGGETRIICIDRRGLNLQKLHGADLLPFRAPDSFSFSPIALADVDGHVASDEFLRRPRQRMCPAGSRFGQFERWEWIWTLLKRSRCTVSFPLEVNTHDPSQTDRGLV